MNKINTGSILKTCVNSMSDELKKKDIRNDIIKNIIQPLICDIVSNYNNYYYSILYLLSVIIFLLIIVILLHIYSLKTYGYLKNNNK